MGLGKVLFYHPVHYLQQLSSEPLADDIEVLNTLMVGFMDVEVSRAWL